MLVVTTEHPLSSLAFFEFDFLAAIFIIFFAKYMGGTSISLENMPHVAMENSVG